MTTVCKLRDCQANTPNHREYYSSRTLTCNITIKPNAQMWMQEYGTEICSFMTALEKAAPYISRLQDGDRFAVEIKSEGCCFIAFYNTFGDQKLITIVNVRPASTLALDPDDLVITMNYATTVSYDLRVMQFSQFCSTPTRRIPHSTTYTHKSTNEFRTYTVRY